MAAQRLSRAGGGEHAPGPAAGGDRCLRRGARADQRPARARTRAGLLPRLSGLRGHGDRRSAKRASDGWPKRCGWSRRRISTRSPRAPSRYAAAALVRQQRGDHLGAARHLENVRRLGPLLHGRPVAQRRSRTALRRHQPGRRRPRGRPRLRAGCGRRTPGVSRRGSATRPAAASRRADQAAARPSGSPRPSYGSWGSCRRISRCRRSPIACHLSRATVKTHVASIYHKLGVPGRSEAVEIIERFGLGSHEPAHAGPGAGLRSQRSRISATSAEAPAGGPL